jgi:hypothetical protein
MAVIERATAGIRSGSVHQRMAEFKQATTLIMRGLPASFARASISYRAGTWTVKRNGQIVATAGSPDELVQRAISSPVGQSQAMLRARAKIEACKRAAAAPLEKIAAVKLAATQSRYR